jgi:beta-mannosidase
VLLETEWQLRAALGREWEWHVGPDEPWDAPGWLPARVPGSVLDDLMRAGEVPDVYRDRNSRLAEWVPERAWIYRARVQGPLDLEFGGVDYEATVFVDGIEAAHHEGLFTAFRVAIAGGERLLAVVVHEAPESEPQVGRTSKVRVHKPRMSYGWDFCPRLVHQGIWRPVRVVRAEQRAVSVRLEDGHGIVECGGEEARVESPELWWPSGMGEPRLYTIAVGGRDVTVGFRTVELRENYRLFVNGRRLDVKGWNWVPIDALYGVPRPDKLAHLLGLAKRADVNLLRVWGGGLVETDEFYDLCDRLGLLVWQEFSQSSSGIESAPSDDPAFLKLMAGDAREIVARLRHRPSLAIWCGGNELDADDSTPVIRALREVVHQLDPGRAWLPTSPLGERADVHGPWEHQGLRRHYEHYDSVDCLLHSEFGVEGMTNRRALEALVDEERRWPPDRSNPVYEHLGAWWNNAPLVQQAFGGGIHDVATMRRASQWLQFEGLRYAVEAGRRRGAGTIPWQLNESYPNAWCTAAIDHRGDPKPAYWGVARAYADGHPSAQFATCAWGGESEARARIHGGAPARFVDVDGTVVAESADGEIAAPLDAFSSDVFLLDLGRNRYVMTRTENLAPLLDLEAATVEAEREDGRLRLRHTRGPAAIGIVIEDARPHDASGWVVFGDNVIDLLPGEERTIGIEGDGDLVVEGWNVRVG